MAFLTVANSVRRTAGALVGRTAELRAASWAERLVAEKAGPRVLRWAAQTAGLSVALKENLMAAESEMWMAGSMAENWAAGRVSHWVVATAVVTVAQKVGCWAVHWALRWAGTRDAHWVARRAGNSAEQMAFGWAVQ